MTLNQFGALWLARKRIVPENPEASGSGADDADFELSPDLDREGVAIAIVAAVKDAHLREWPHVVELNKDQMAQESTSWQTVFGVRDSILRHASKSDGSKSDTAFAEYVALRWTFRFIWLFEIRPRPSNRPLPPSFDQQARLGLANQLAGVAQRLGLRMDSGKLEAESNGWRNTNDVAKAVMKHTGG